MSRTLGRALLDLLKPPGLLWQPEPEEDLDLQWDGISDSTQDVIETLDSLADIRNPSKTPVFNDLERNYGIKPNSIIPDSDREMFLSQKVYQGEKQGSATDLQAELDAAGFDLQVHKNDPPVDPATFLTQSFQITAGSDKAYAGYNLGGDILAFAANLGGELLVNTPLFLQSNAVEMQAGGAFGYAGYTADGVDSEACAGYFTGLRQDELTYPTPTASTDWAKMFFVGGDATRNASGELTSIEAGFVQLNRHEDLIKIILQARMMGAWCGLIVIKV